MPPTSFHRSPRIRWSPWRGTPGPMPCPYQRPMRSAMAGLSTRLPPALLPPAPLAPLACQSIGGRWRCRVISSAWWRHALIHHTSSGSRAICPAKSTRVLELLLLLFVSTPPHSLSTGASDQRLITSLNFCACRRDISTSNPPFSRTRKPPLAQGSMVSMNRRLRMCLRLARKKIAGSSRSSR